MSTGIDLESLVLRWRAADQQWSNQLQSTLVASHSNHGEMLELLQQADDGLDDALHFMSDRLAEAPTAAAAAERKIADAQAATDRYKAALDAAQLEASVLRAELSRNQTNDSAKIAALESEIKKQKESNNRLVQDNDHLLRQRNDLQQQGQATQQRLDESNRDLRSCKQREADLLHSQALAQSSASDVTSTINALQSELDRLRAEALAERESREAEQKKNAQLNDRHTAALEIKAALEDQVEQLSERLQALNTRYESFVQKQKEEFAALNGRLSAGAAELLKEKGKLDQTTAALQKAERLAASLQLVVHESATELDARHATINTLNAQLKSSHVAMAELEKTRKALLDEQQQSRAFSDESAAVVSRLEKKSAQQKAIIQKLHDQLQAMKAQLEALAMPHGSRASAAARQKGGLLDTVLHEMNKLEDSVQRL